MNGIVHRIASRPRCGFGPVLAVCVFLPAAHAHHGTSTFDGDRVVALEGVVIENRWRNPHSFILFETRDASGAPRRIEIEADGPSLLGPLGATADSLVPGERVVAYVSPSRRAGSDDVLGREIVKADGTTVALSVRYARERATGAVPAASRVVGSWVPARTALFEFVPWRATWSLTPAGLASVERYDISAPFAQAECIAATAPTVMLYPTAKIVREIDEGISIDTDWMGATRTVYMDGRDHPPPSETFLQGHSIGRWEGTTLVIDTTNFSDNEIGNAFGVASGPRKHLVERLTLAEDGKQLTYAFTLEDPDYLSEPVRNEYVWHHRPDVAASGVACDLEAAGRYLEE